MFARDMHHIQREIIAQLARQSPQRFSQLQPTRIPNNTFSYHLKKLIQMGYVLAVDGGYVPTRKALKTLQYTDNNVQHRRQGPPATLSMIYLTNSRDEVLLLRRQQRPFSGWHGLPSGLIHKGESITEAAHRELMEKTSIDTHDLTYRGTLDFKYLEQSSGDLFVHAIAFVFSHQLDTARSDIDGYETSYGTLAWSRLHDQLILPEVLSAKELASHDTPSLVSIDFDEPNALTPATTTRLREESPEHRR